MTKPYFHPAFTRYMAICRYAVYLCTLAFLTFYAWRDMQHLSPAVVYFILAPALWHLCLRGRRVTALRAHTLEAALSLLLLVYLQAPLGLLVAFTGVAVVSNTALWGMGSGPVRMILVVSSVWGVGVISGAVHWRVDPWTDVLVLSLSFAAVLAVSGLAHWQAHLLLAHRSAIRDDYRALLPYLPAELPAHLRKQRSPVHTRVWLTVVFIDLVGFTQATEELPPEALQGLLNDFLGEAAEHVESWGGSISKFLGDGVLCVFSAPDPGHRGVVAQRCVTGLCNLPEWVASMNRRWRKLGYLQSFDVTAGVASGYCTLGEWGRGKRLDYTVIGPPVNLACRLQGEAANRGGLLIDETTARLIEPACSVGVRTRVNLKGLQSTVAYMPMAV